MNEIFHLSVAQELEIAARIVFAGLLGCAVGFERRQADKPAGIRTLGLVSIGAALFTVVSAFAFDGADPSRIAAQIVTGLDFLEREPSCALEPTSGVSPPQPAFG